MEQYAGRLLADRYRLPRPPADAYELVETRAYDTASGQEVLVRQVPLPEVVDAEVLDGGHTHGPGPQRHARTSGLATRTPDDPVVRRALEAAAAAASLPDHARLDQIFDVFVQGDGLWIVSELVPGRPLAALLAEHRMGPYRAAEIAADVLAALRVVHAHGWTHRNITARTVLVCDDGRAMLTGLAAGAAEEVLCGYDPFPVDPAGQPGTTLIRETADAGDAGAPPPVPGAREAAPRPPGEQHDGPQPHADRSRGGVHPPAPGAGREDGRARGHHDESAGSGYHLPPGWNAPGRPAASGGTLPPGRGPAPDDAPRGLPPHPGDHRAPHDDHREPSGRTRGHYAQQENPQHAGEYTDRIGVPDEGRFDATAPPATGGGESRHSPWDRHAPEHPFAAERHGTPPAQYGDGGHGGYGGGHDGPHGEAVPHADGVHRDSRYADSPYADSRYADGRHPDGGGEGMAPEPAHGAEAEQRGAYPAVPGALPAGWDLVPGHGPVDPDADQAAADRHAYHPDRAVGGGGPQSGPASPRGPVPLHDPSARPGGAPHHGAQPPRRSAEPSAASVERASRRGAIAAYRAGTRAGADAVHGTGRQPDQDRSGAPDDAAPPALPPVRRGEGPTELPGAPRPGRPVATGWESAPPRPPAPGRDPQRAVPALPPAREAVTEQLPRIPVQEAETVPERQPGTGIVPGAAGRYRGPDNALAADRARQARMTTVGAVTERWAPEQAGPVHEHWRLSPPVGPAADLWALGALLFRAVQGHPPYPEDSVAELVQAVIAEQPAFAEECGALRPVVESLLRQDPTERPSEEELRGWLRSIIRSAPEPDVGRRTVTLPPMLEAGRPSDPTRLPIVRHRGELVSKRKRRSGSPRALGRLLLVAVFCLVAGAMAFALLFMPSDDERSDTAAPGGSPSDQDGPAPGSPGEEPDDAGNDPEVTDEPVPAPDGFDAVSDEAGFGLVVPEGWERGTGPDDSVTFEGDGLVLTVVPGRDGAAEFGEAPMEYQLQSQPELQGYRDAPWRSSGSLRSITVGQVAFAEGDFLWDGGEGRQFVRNRAMLIGDDYHVVMLRGTEDDRDAIAELFPTVAESYRVR